MAQAIERQAADPGFRLDLAAPESRVDTMFPAAGYRRPWSHAELLAIFPEQGIRALDVGAGRRPLEVRPQDEIVTVDFEADAGTTITSDVVAGWPFGSQEFDLIYMSHVLEHFYPSDRDAVVRNVYDSLREGGILFIRVPHMSSHQAIGWEHFSLFGLSGVSGLCHGHNPMLPMFRTIGAGVSLSIDFYAKPAPVRRAVERALSRYWAFTDMVVSRLPGVGIAMRSSSC